jgi:hypothetical protein
MGRWADWGESDESGCKRGENTCEIVLMEKVREEAGGLFAMSTDRYRTVESG